MRGVIRATAMGWLELLGWKEKKIMRRDRKEGEGGCKHYPLNTALQIGAWTLHLRTLWKKDPNKYFVIS